MKFDYGLVIVVISMVVFYIRLAQLRGRRRRQARELELQQSRSNKKRKPGDPPLSTSKDLPTYQVASWWLVLGGVVFMLIGLAMRTSNIFPAVVLPYWWAVTVVGVALFTLGLK